MTSKFQTKNKLKNGHKKKELKNTTYIIKKEQINLIN